MNNPSATMLTSSAGAAAAHLKIWSNSNDPLSAKASTMAMIIPQSPSRVTMKAFLAAFRAESL